MLASNSAFATAFAGTFMDVGTRCCALIFMAFATILANKRPRSTSIAWFVMAAAALVMFAALQDYTTVRQWLFAIDTSLTPRHHAAQGLDSQDYAAHCEFTQANLWSRFDFFIFAHFMGYVFKALILRDVTLCWAISLCWELSEIIWTPILPNFAECWWDRWLYDLVLSNGLGICCGCVLCRLLELEDYRWHPSCGDELIAVSAAPMGVRESQRLPSKSAYTLCVLGAVGIENMGELILFFFKDALEIPTSNVITFAWAFVSGLALTIVANLIGGRYLRGKEVTSWFPLWAMIMFSVAGLSLVVKFGWFVDRPGVHDAHQALYCLVVWFAMEVGVTLAFVKAALALKRRVSLRGWAMEVLDKNKF